MDRLLAPARSGWRTRTSPVHTVVLFTAVALVATVVFVLTHSSTAQAFSSGQVRHNGNPLFGGATCTECHTPAARPNTVTLDGPAALQRGETGTFTLTMTDGPGEIGGFNVSTTDLLGAFIPVPGESRLLFDEITHSSPKPFADEVVTFTFDWTAPTESQTITLYAAGVSANDNGNNGGDSVDTTTLQVRVGNSLGDANDDQMVDEDDATAILQQLVGLNPDPFDADAADVNEDGVVELLDALVIAQDWCQLAGC